MQNLPKKPFTKLVTNPNMYQVQKTYYAQIMDSAGSMIIGVDLAKPEPMTQDYVITPNMILIFQLNKKLFFVTDVMKTIILGYWMDSTDPTPMTLTLDVGKSYVTGMHPYWLQQGQKYLHHFGGRVLTIDKFPDNFEVNKTIWVTSGTKRNTKNHLMQEKDFMDLKLLGDGT